MLPSSFHLNGHNIGFHSQTQKWEPPCAISNSMLKLHDTWIKFIIMIMIMIMIMIIIIITM